MRRFIQDKGRTSKPQVWDVEVGRNKVVTTWGQLKGKMQETTQTFSTPLNKGKKNEKSAQIQADEFAEREVTKRIRSGYREVSVRSGEFLEQASSNEIDFIRLPEHLRFFKPQNSLNVHCGKLIDGHNALILRKRDGMMHVASTGEDGHPRLYSSTMQIHHKDEPGIPFMDRFAHLEEAFLKMKMPKKTVLLGELVTCAASGYGDDIGMGRDDFAYVGSIMKSLTPLSIEKQLTGGKLGYCIWDIGFWDGQCWLVSATAEDRFNFIWNLVKDAGPWITMPEMIELTDSMIVVTSEEAGESFELEYCADTPVEDLTELAKEWSWEGYVIVDPKASYGDRSYSMHGKAERPKFVCKLKPKYEADFIVRWDPDNGIGKWGKGKKSKGVGSVQAYLWDQEKGEVEVSLVGGGLKDKDVVRFADPKMYPLVWQIEYDSMTPKGSLRFPEFIRDRTDKRGQDCTWDQIPQKFLDAREVGCG